MRFRILYVFSVFTCLICLTAGEGLPHWRWTCRYKKCMKTKNYPQDGKEPILNMDSCKMYCNRYGLLWPRPTGEINFGSHLSKINTNKIEYVVLNEGRTSNLQRAAGERFKLMVSKMIPSGLIPKSIGKLVVVYLNVLDANIREFSLGMDEGYSIKVSEGSTNASSINATVTGENFFGVRHGLETLLQLIIYDEIRNQVLMVRDATIEDRPVYSYRGILLDTARNYFDIDSIKQTIDAMAAVKLNTFHWHITDSQSFPFVSERRPNLSKWGAYSPSKIYTKTQIFEIVEYALERGVRVLPEFAAPAHVGEGWQDTGLTICFKANPWPAFCFEPPCGQLNPARDEVYQYLGDIYWDMADVFQTDLFHMGGNDVMEGCWNSSNEIQEFMLLNRWNLTNEGFLDLWDYFQRKAQDKVYEAFGKRLPLILWTSSLTDPDIIDKYLNREDYIVQVTWDQNSEQVDHLLSKGYRIIVSSNDAYNLAKRPEDLNIDSNNTRIDTRQIEWKDIYDNNIMENDHRNLILGGEVLMWSDHVDSASLHSRLWPHAAALAERLWSNPDTDSKTAYYRMSHTRERLARMGIKGEMLASEWCTQNEGFCYRFNRF